MSGFFGLYFEWLRHLIAKLCLRRRLRTLGKHGTPFLTLQGLGGSQVDAVTPPKRKGGGQQISTRKFSSLSKKGNFHVEIFLFVPKKEISMWKIFSQIKNFRMESFKLPSNPPRTPLEHSRKFPHGNLFLIQNSIFVLKKIKFRNILATYLCFCIAPIFISQLRFSYATLIFFSLYLCLVSVSFSLTFTFTTYRYIDILNRYIIAHIYGGPIKRPQFQLYHLRRSLFNGTLAPQPQALTI